MLYSGGEPTGRQGQCELDSLYCERAGELDLNIADDIRALWNEGMVKVRRGDAPESWSEAAIRRIAELRECLDQRDS